MSEAPIEVLLVEDDADQAHLVQRTLKRQETPFRVTAVADGAACLEALGRQPCSVVLLDFSLPRQSGLDVLAEIRRRGVPVPVIMVTAQGDERVAVEAMQAGAVDYLVKTPGYLTTLPTVIRKVLKQHELAQENARLYAEAQRSLADLRAAQEQLVRGATLRALGEMASGAAHHLNNLLAVVMGRVQLLLNTRPEPTLERSLRVIERAAADAAEVVRRVQRFARSDSSEQRHRVDLGEVAREVIQMTRARWQDEAQARSVRIDVTFDPQPAPPVRANAAALREVLTNLVLNAVDALPQGGRIAIRTFGADGCACLAVSDDGPGMPDDVRERALEPFFTTKGPRGTGLGLSVSYGIVRSHGGELTIESAPGQGTTVCVRLPEAPLAVPPPSEAPPPAAPPGPPCRVVVVDDEPVVRDTLTEMVRRLGHEVTGEAAGGPEALDLLAGGRIADLVLTDLGMPGMTGWDLARAIRSRWPRLAVALVTGWGEQVDPASREPALVVSVLGKPVSLSALGRLLDDQQRRLAARPAPAPPPARPRDAAALAPAS